MHCGRWNIKNIGGDKQCCERNLLPDWNRVNVSAKKCHILMHSGAPVNIPIKALAKDVITIITY